MIADVQSLAEALAEIHERRPKERIDAVATTRNSQLSTTNVRHGGPFGWGVTTTYSFRDETIARIKLGGLVTSSVDQESPLNIAGLSPSDVLPAVWEIVPFSWLVDYTTNVGSLLSLFSTPVMDFQDHWAVEVLESRRSITVSVDRSLAPNATWRSIRFSGGENSLVTNFKWVRDVGDMSHYRQPIFTWKNPFSSIGHDMNLAAVALAQFGGHAAEEAADQVNRWRTGR